MKIVALDLATSTGVAVGKPAAAPVHFSVDLGKKQSEDARFSKALALTDKLIREHQPDLIAVEAAVGGPKASGFLIGLVACVRGVACNRGVPVELYHLGAIRKHFTGKAWQVRDFPHLSQAAAKKAIKAEVIKRCELLGWHPTTDDEADALALLDYALAVNTKHQSKVAGGLV